MSEPYDTGRDPLNAALDRLHDVLLRRDSSNVAIIAAAIAALKASDRAIGWR